MTDQPDQGDPKAIIRNAMTELGVAREAIQYASGQLQSAIAQMDAQYAALPVAQRRGWNGFNARVPRNKLARALGWIVEHEDMTLVVDLDAIIAEVAAVLDLIKGPPAK